MGKRASNGQGSFSFVTKKNLWCYSATINTFADGKKRKYFYGKTKGICIEKYQKFLEDMGGIATAPADKRTVGDIGATIIQTRKINAKEDTKDRLEVTFKHQIMPTIGNIPIVALTDDDIQCLLIAWMIDKGYAKSTIKKAFQLTNQICKYALGRKLIKVNPCLLVELPKDNKGMKQKITYLTDAEICRFKEACRSTFPNSGKRKYKNGEAYILMMRTGLRMGELLALQWDAVDIEGKRIRIFRTAKEVKNRSKDGSNYIMKVYDHTKTEAGTREIPLSDGAIESLLYLQSIADQECKFVIQNQRGTNNVVPANSFIKTCNLILKNANINKSGTHLLRHTFATHCFKNDIDIKYVSAWLGHKDVSTTYNIYVHIIEEKSREELGKLPEI